MPISLFRISLRVLSHGLWTVFLSFFLSRKGPWRSKPMKTENAAHRDLLPQPKLFNEIQALNDDEKLLLNEFKVQLRPSVTDPVKSRWKETNLVPMLKTKRIFGSTCLVQFASFTTVYFVSILVLTTLFNRIFLNPD